MIVDMRWLEQVLHLEAYSDKLKGSYDPDLRAQENSCYTLGQIWEIYEAGRSEHLRALESAAVAAIFWSLTSLESLEVNFWRDPIQITR